MVKLHWEWSWPIFLRRWCKSMFIGINRKSRYYDPTVQCFDHGLYILDLEMLGGCFSSLLETLGSTPVHSISTVYTQRVTNIPQGGMGWHCRDCRVAQVFASAVPDWCDKAHAYRSDCRPQCQRPTGHLWVWIKSQSCVTIWPTEIVSIGGSIILILNLYPYVKGKIFEATFGAMFFGGFRVALVITN